MQELSLYIFLMLLSASWSIEVHIKKRYHQEVGIPLAKHIKVTEEVSRKNRRSVGGGPASPYIYPYMAGLLITLENPNWSACSASLVSHQHLLSAAHCWYDGMDQAALYTVVLGSKQLFEGGLRIDTSDVVVHPEWDPDTLSNDISILYLPKKIRFSAKIRPIALPSQMNLSKTFAGYRAVVIGFGQTSDKDNSLNEKNVFSSYAKVKVITNKMCRAYYDDIPRTQICTSGRGRVGTCDGDSGGPLVIKTLGNDILIGISSYSDKKSCQRGKPSGYTRVTEFYSFIYDHICGHDAITRRRHRYLRMKSMRGKAYLAKSHCAIFNQRITYTIVIT